MKTQTKYFHTHYAGYTCIIPTLTFNTHPVMPEGTTIETYYTYAHINMILCAFGSGIGIVVCITHGKATLHYYDIDTKEKIYPVRIKTLSIYAHEVYLQLEHRTTLWILRVLGSEKMFGKYRIAEVYLRKYHLLKKDQRYEFSVALFQIL
ncbi:MAG: hypothetical protein IKL88_06785 [Erysipelotrichales bacterium]|nr:hypothetical protein [Erysipelotrichales bacterium]